MSTASGGWRVASGAAGWIVSVAAWLFAAVGSAAADDARLEAIARSLDRQPVLRAEFEQTKRMAVLKRPLITGGRMTYSREAGVLWRIERPYRMTYVLGRERIVEIGADGQRRTRTGRDLPGLSEVGRVFRALLGADLSALREHFTAEVRGDAGRWQVELTPRQPQIAKLLHRLELTGGRNLDSVRIDEASGDSTRIEFRQARGGETLDEGERGFFAGE